MNIEYIIVQAGGKGTRLMPLTRNRPKSLVPVNNKPILFHLFQKYSDKKFIIIGDYKFQVLSRYLENYAAVNYMLVHSTEVGNAAGIREALRYIPEGKPFMVIWSDLLLDAQWDFDALADGCYVGVTDKFPCSWRFQDGALEKTTSATHGVAGCFLFDRKERIADMPSVGSFTKYLKEAPLTLAELPMGNTAETGTLEALSRVDSKENRCRPYNRITMQGEIVIKEGLTKEAVTLIDREVKWYRAVDQYGFKGIPKVYALEPLTIARIHGDNIFKVPLTDAEKKSVVDQLYARLDELHNLVKGTPDYFDMQEDYYAKTMKRLRSIESVIPFSNADHILINGKQCVNVLTNPDFLRDKVHAILQQDATFGIIHGDCTLTNTLIDQERNIYFIDARGYFGKTELIGDVYYDWAKVYYSLEGAFDQFNVRNFEMTIGDKEVRYQIGSSGWEHLTQYFLDKIPNCDVYRIKLIHAIVWLSLASHCWEDYDSLCLAYYNGLYLLNTLEG